MWVGDPGFGRAGLRSPTEGVNGELALISCKPHFFPGRAQVPGVGGGVEQRTNLASVCFDCDTLSLEEGDRECKHLLTVQSQV